MPVTTRKLKGGKVRVRSTTPPVEVVKFIDDERSLFGNGAVHFDSYDSVADFVPYQANAFPSSFLEGDTEFGLTLLNPKERQQGFHCGGSLLGGQSPPPTILTSHHRNMMASNHAAEGFPESIEGHAVSICS